MVTSSIYPEAEALAEILSAAKNGEDRRVSELVDSLHTTLRDVPGLTEERASMLVARLADGKTLADIAEEHGLSRERIRQQTQLVKSRDVQLVRGSLVRDLVQREKSAISALYRTGLDIDQVIDELDLLRFGGPLEAVRKLISKDILTTRDKTINGIHSGGSDRSTVKTWGEPEMLAGLRRVAKEACDGAAPSNEAYEDYRQEEKAQLGSYGLPSVALVVARHGSWTAALQAAGFDVSPAGWRSDKYWTAEKCIEHMLRLIRELDELPAVGPYDKIAQERPDQPDPLALPSSATARNQIGQIGVPQWDSIRALLVQRLLDTGEW